MARIFNLGSLNLDHVYSVERFVMPGETMAVQDYQLHLGGKGLNHSVAAARSGAHVTHIGCCPSANMSAFEAVNTPTLEWMIEDTATPAGHTIIEVDAKAENRILLFPGANRAHSIDHIQQAKVGAGDWFLAQNETNLVPQAMAWAKSKGAKIAYAAAPFDAQAVQAILPLIDIIAMNAVEAAELTASTGLAPSALGIETVIVTKGAEGADLYRHCQSHRGEQPEHFAAFNVTAVDTTGAGDCFFGNVLGQLSQGVDLHKALNHAQAAAAIQVTRQGAANAMPTQHEVHAFLETNRNRKQNP